MYMKWILNFKINFKYWFFIQIITFIITFAFIPKVMCAEAPASNPQYQIEIPMKTNLGQNGQTVMIQEALSDLLVRLSGTETILEKPVIKNALEQADRYSKQISYHQPSPNIRTIRVQFKEAQVKNLIWQAREKVWDTKRPLTLAVLILDNHKKPTWVGQDFATQPMQEIQSLAAKRGLLIVFPMLDLTDTSQVSEQDVKDLNLAKLESLATRYNSDIIWTGKIKEENGKYTGNFLSMKKGKNIEFDAEGDSLASMLKDALEQLSDILKDINPNTIRSDSNSASSDAVSKAIPLTITGSLDGERYIRVMNYLIGLPAVTDVVVEQISADKTIFSIETSNSKDELASLISRDPILIENTVVSETTISNTSTPERNLSYKLSEAL